MAATTSTVAILQAEQAGTVGAAVADSSQRHGDEEVVGALATSQAINKSSLLTPSEVRPATGLTTAADGECNAPPLGAQTLGTDFAGGLSWLFGDAEMWEVTSSDSGSEADQEELWGKEEGEEEDEEDDGMFG